MLRRSLVAAVALLAATSAVAAPASAFVVPRWNSAREAKHASILGTWHAIALKKSGVPVDDPSFTIVIGPKTLFIDGGEATGGASYSVVGEDANLLTLHVTTKSGKEVDVDVLVEGPDALTLWVTDDDGEDDEVVRLERD